MNTGNSILFYQSVIKEVVDHSVRNHVLSQQLMNANSIAWKFYPDVWSANMLVGKLGKCLDKACHIEQGMKRSHIGHWLSQSGPVIRLKRACFRREFREALIPQMLHIRVECRKGKFLWQDKSFVVLHQQILDDKSLQTLLCEAVTILNSQGLCTISDHKHYPEASTTIHILLLKCHFAFHISEIRHVETDTLSQYHIDLFWKKWTEIHWPLL